MGLMMILIGGFLPSAIFIPFKYPPGIIELPSTWQVPAVLLSGVICGPRAAFIASTAYITVGHAYLPLFHEGGGLEYIQTPGFGYIVGFIPASWLTARLIQKTRFKTVISITFACIAGLLVIHTVGILNLLIGAAISTWPKSLHVLIINYSVTPIPFQAALCPTVAMISLPLRRLLILE